MEFHNSYGHRKNPQNIIIHKASSSKVVKLINNLQIGRYRIKQVPTQPYSQKTCNIYSPHIHLIKRIITNRCAYVFHIILHSINWLAFVMLCHS